MAETSVAVPSTSQAPSALATWLRAQDVDDASYADLIAGRVPDRLIRKRTDAGGDPALFVGGAFAVLALLPIVAGVSTGEAVWWGVGAGFVTASVLAFAAARLRPRGPRAGYDHDVVDGVVDVVVRDHVIVDEDGNERRYVRAHFTLGGRGHEVVLSTSFAPVLRACAPTRARVLHVRQREGHGLYVFVPG